MLKGSENGRPRKFVSNFDNFILKLIRLSHFEVHGIGLHIFNKFIPIYVVLLISPLQLPFPHGYFFVDLRGVSGISLYLFHFLYPFT